MFWILHRNPGTRSATRRHLLPPCQTDRPRKIRCTRDRGSGPHEISPGRSLHRNPTPWVVLSVVGWDRSRHVGAKEQGLCFVPPFFAVFSPFPSQYSLEYRVVKRMIARQPPSLDTDGRSLMNCAFLFFFSGLDTEGRREGFCAGCLALVSAWGWGAGHPPRSKSPKTHHPSGPHFPRVNMGAPWLARGLGIPMSSFPMVVLGSRDAEFPFSRHGQQCHDET